MIREGRALSVGGGVIAGVIAAVISGNFAAPSRPHLESTDDGITYGRVPDTAFVEGGLDRSKAPDFIEVATDDGVGSLGYVKLSDVEPTDNTHPADVIEVYGDDLRTIIGHMYASRGFVPLGSLDLPPFIEHEVWSDE